jgi:PAT family beta-lactamase induction signal transducer AmpG
LNENEHTRPALLQSKMFWVGILYFAEGFPLGVFYDVFPVHFRQQGVNLAGIGLLSLLGLTWTLKFLWAPAVDHYRHHRRWMFGSDICMAAILLGFAAQTGFGPWVWVAIGTFTLLSATNDIAIDGYTIEMLDRRELGLANGLRIAFYRVGMLTAGVILICSDMLGWAGAYTAGAVVFLLAGLTCLNAPRERYRQAAGGITTRGELKGLLSHPLAFAGVVLFLMGVLWLTDRTTQWSGSVDHFWWYIFAGAALLILYSGRYTRRAGHTGAPRPPLAEGPVFGALLEMLQRPYILPVILFILIFKLGDSAMGFMIKPFWVDSGFSAAQIGLVSVNIGLGLSIAGGIVGGWFTDRAGIFRGLWVLGLLQAVSNLGYAWAAVVIPSVPVGTPVAANHQVLMYLASAIESFTSGLGTAAFLAFLMAIVNRRHSATEYALLSSIFALSRSVAGWASGYGAEAMGYADYFLLTFFLAFPAYLLLPWIRKMLAYADRQPDEGQDSQVESCEDNVISAGRGFAADDTDPGTVIPTGTRNP